MPNTPSLLSVSPYSRAIAREMYPGQMGQDDQQDAARHMLAAGTMARKYGPTVADLAGKAHEYSTSPLRAFMTLIGRGQMPPDYELDMHNNALGIELAKRAQSQRELEDLIQSAAERATTTKTQGRPMVKKAKGGEVSADELNRPFIGYRSAGRRPESQQDRRAAADAPLSALRGMVSGVLGAPGDIESLVRMLPGLSERTVLPTSEDIEKRLPMRELNQTPTGRAFTTAGQLGGGFYTGPGAPLRAVAALPSAVSRAGRDFLMSTSPVNVVKPKGGNWLNESVQDAIRPLRQTGLVNDVEIPYGPAYEEAARQRIAFLRSAAAQPTYRGGAETSARVLEADLNTPRQPEMAINRWLETKLGKYIKNEMATPEDPIRALAESWPARKQELLTGKDVQIAKARADMEKARAARGFTPEMMTSSQARIRDLEKERELIAAREGLHSEISPTGYNVSRARLEAGFPEEGMGVSPLAKTWEDRADTFVNPLKASDLTSGYYREAVEANPWLLKVPPETPVYEMLRGSEGDSSLGFGHLVDELRNALNPSSGLPPELLLKYTDLEKKTVPDIVNQVADINAWRAVQKAEADAVRAMGPAVHTFKEYPEQGFKWVELKAPKETGRKITVEKSEMDLPPDMDQRQMREAAEDMAFDEGFDEGTPEFNDFVRNLMTDFNRKKKVEMDESYKALEDALKYEGEVLQHCVGGYCPDVIEGRSKIFSLRDKKGQPHVTIEVAPAQHLDYNKWFASQTEDMQNEIARRRMEDKNYNVYETPEYLAARADLPPEIVQIKGKKNQAPASEYLPAVQDFIRSGKFGKIGDLQNAGLVDVQDPNALLRALGKVSPERNIDQAIDNFNTAIDSAPNAQRYMTLDELRDFLGGSTGPEGLAQGGQVRGYAEGGQVSGANFPTGDFDPARIDAIVDELHALNAG